MKSVLLSAVIAALCLGTAPLAAQVVNETDRETGLTVHYLTDDQHINTIGYPTCRTWSSDGRFVFIESTRPRPDGTSKPLERQILKIEAATGQTTHMAILDVENTAKYGDAHIRASSQYHFDYAPNADVMVYYDMTGHNMYLMDVSSGRSGLILHEHEGTIGDPPAITPDGTRVVYYVFYPSTPNRFLGPMTSVIFSLNVNPETLEAKGEPRIITAYPGRMVEAYKDKLRNGVVVNHCQVNPIDHDHFCYAHEFGGARPDGTLTMTRTWQNRNGIDSPVYRPKEGEWQTHEVIGPLGKCLYFVENRGVSAVDFETGQKRRVYDKDKYQAIHISISPDEKWIAADTWDGEPDKDGCFHGGILLIETATGKSKLLCECLAGRGHPRHPHPNFSSDGKRIAFTTAVGPDRSRVAYVDISDIINNWD